jgi:hypothetical protein
LAAKRVLMVEGADDEHVVKHVCHTRGLGLIDTIHPYGGRVPLLDGIGPRLKESEIAALGILLDADSDLAASWTAIRDRLHGAGYAMPAQPEAAGTVVAAPVGKALLPRVGVWLMPNNQVPGILEDFLRFLVPPGAPLFTHVEQAVATIPAEHRRFTDLARPKAMMHTWLAWQETPGRPFGQAISARYLDPDLPSANAFAEWLHRTFFA